jgi:hypothetical protein
MREVRQGRDRTLPPPRHLGPGEREVEGHVLYSAAWLDAARPRLVDCRKHGRPGSGEAGDELRKKLAHPLADLHDRLETH